MVKQSKINIRNNNKHKENIAALVKPTESHEDELINSLSKKRENRRAQQTWHWETVRRNSVKLQ